MSHISDINSAYKKLNARADALYEFVTLYHNYIYAHHTYENEHFNMMEIHTLTFIDDSPGITATELSKICHKSKSAVSQVIKKLADSGHVIKRYKENNEKSVCLYATEKGRRLSSVHKAYDVADITQTTSYLIEACGEPDLDSFYRIIKKYSELLKSGLEP